MNEKKTKWLVRYSSAFNFELISYTEETPEERDERRIREMKKKGVDVTI